VEDDPRTAEATESFLEVVMRVERKVVVAGCAEETIELLRADPCRWRLILLDLRIPGAEGLSVAMQIKDLGLAPITCLRTAEDPRKYVAKVREQGFLGYIWKGGFDLATDMEAVLAGRPSFPSVDDQLPTADRSAGPPVASLRQDSDGDCQSARYAPSPRRKLHLGSWLRAGFALVVGDAEEGDCPGLDQHSALRRLR
jgi:DNA-binding NarL/FixJ family response regulator